MEEGGFEFDVRVITPDEAEAPGLLEKLEELEEKNIASTDYERLEDL